MSDLANYSIETDQVVLLSFKDGRSLRVPLKHLARYLKPGDLAKVKKALNLRRHFLRIHMPRFFVILAAIGGLVALLAVGGKTVAGLFSRPGTPPVTPHHTGIARNQLLPTPELSPGVQQPEQADARLAATKRSVAKSKVSNLGSTAAASTPAPAPAASTPLPLVDQASLLASPAPSTSPMPSPSSSPSSSPKPAPSASPSPSPSPQGQVLSDATSAPAK